METVVDSPTPFAAAARALLRLLPHTSSAQLALLLEIERTVVTHRRQIEKCCAPTAVAPRPVAGQSRSREAESLPLPPPPRVVKRWEGLVARSPPLGTVTIIAGHETEEGYVNGPASSARFSYPFGMLRMSNGDLIIVEVGNNCLRRLADGVVSTFVGETYDAEDDAEESLRDGPAALARFNGPSSIARDAQGNMFVTDELNYRIRVVASDGATTTIGGADGLAVDAGIPTTSSLRGIPSTVVVAKDDGTVFVTTTNQGYHRVHILTSDGRMTPLAGEGSWGFTDGLGEAAKFHNIQGMVEGPDGRLFVADTENCSIRCIDREGNVTTVAGKLYDPDTEGDDDMIDGEVAHATFSSPIALAVASDGAIYVADDAGGMPGGRVRLIDKGQVSTLATIVNPLHGLLLDEDTGVLYVSGTSSIRTIAVPSRAERRMTRDYPIMRTWWLVQAERAQMVALTAAAANNQSAAAKREICARSVLRLLMRCPVVGVLTRTLGFVFG